MVTCFFMQRKPNYWIWNALMREIQIFETLKLRIVNDPNNKCIHGLSTRAQVFLGNHKVLAPLILLTVSLEAKPPFNQTTEGLSNHKLKY